MTEEERQTNKQTYKKFCVSRMNGNTCARECHPQCVGEEKHDRGDFAMSMCIATCNEKGTPALDLTPETENGTSQENAIRVHKESRNCNFEAASVNRM